MDNQASHKPSMPSMYKELSDATCKCPITKNKYIPAQKLHEIVTVEKVNHELHSKRGWMRSMRSLLRRRSFENNVERARKFIAIIALIDKLDDDSIKSLAAHGLTDKDLPLSRDGNFLQCHRRTKKFNFPTWGEASIGLFLERQWRVLAPILKFEADHPIDVPLDENCALELSNCKIAYATQFSQVYYAEVLPSVNKAESIRIAVKAFYKDTLKDYKLEKSNLKKITDIDNAHLIKHLATCEQIPAIMFPWADCGDLNEFWKRDSESKRTIDVFKWSLEQLTGLASALKDLHSINCRHGDLKPSNILYYKETDAGILKIADLGVSRVHNQETDLRHGVTVTKASTRAYEGPEAYRPDQTDAPRSRRYDCWSMGCIMLEFVIWLLYDNHALECLKGARNSEWNSYYQPKFLKRGSNSRMLEWWETMERHPNVDKAIELLRDDARLRGTVLEKLVNLVDYELLKINPKERLVAAGIHEEMQGIFRQFKERHIRLVHDAPRPPVPLIFSQLPEKVPNTTSQTGYSTNIASPLAIQRV